MKVISSINEKGGTGKTTSVLGIGSQLTQEGKKVLYVDLDYQVNLTTSLVEETITKTAFDLITGTADIVDCIQKDGELHIIPGDIRMRNLNDVMRDELFKETRIKDALEALRGSYDYILIDCRPEMHLAEKNAIIASDGLLVPMEAHVSSIDGFDLLIAFKQKVERQLKKEIPTKAFFTRVARGNSTELTMNYGFENYDNILNTYIRHNIKLQEASTRREAIHSFAPRSNGAKDYTALVEELRANDIL